MILDQFGQLNWLAVILGTIAYFAIGAAWYAPQAMGKQWMAAIGFTGKPKLNPISMALSAVAFLVAAVVTAMIARGVGSDNLVDGIVLGLVLGVGYGGALTAVEAAYEPVRPQPWMWWVVSGSYHVVGLLAVAVLVSVLR